MDNSRLRLLLDRLSKEGGSMQKILAEIFAVRREQKGSLFASIARMLLSGSRSSTGSR